MSSSPGSLIAALGVVLDVSFDGMDALFGLLLIGGWLLSFVVGILQRIAPFLASMHTTPGRHKPPTPSSLTAKRPLAIHFGCHRAALALLAAAVLADSPWIAFAGAVPVSLRAASAPSLWRGQTSRCLEKRATTTKRRGVDGIKGLLGF